MQRHFVVMAMLIAALGLVATGVFAQGADGTKVLDQWKTAVQHSKFSQDYNGMKEITSHLQHTVNCLEGPQGANFDAGVGNPCQGQGGGMIADTRKIKDNAKFAAAVPWMEAADTLAKKGLTQKNPDAAKAYGQATQTVLEVIGAGLK